MPKNYTPYLQKAMRLAAHDILNDVAKDGLEGDSHYFITFETNREDVKIPDFVRAKYPQEISIILQNQFSNLEVSETSFSVDLAFGGVSSTVTVPWTALKVFADPSAQFVLSFEPDHPEKAMDKSTQGTAEIIDLTSLRKSK